MSGVAQAWQRERAEWTRRIVVPWWRGFLALNLAAWAGIWSSVSVWPMVGLLISAAWAAGLFVRGASREEKPT